MTQFEQVLIRAIKYTNKLLSERNDDSLNEQVLFAESSPIQLHNHAISTMIHFSKIDFQNFDITNVIPLSFIEKGSITNQLKLYYEKMQEEFFKSMKRINKDDFEKLSDFISLM